MYLSTDLSQALAAVDRIISTTNDEQALRPSPCEGWSVDEVIQHLTSSLARLAQAFGGAGVELPQSRTAAFRTAAESFAQAVENHDGDSVKVPWGELPTRAAISLALIEVVVHGWDIAVGEGRQLRVDDALAERALVASQQLMGKLPAGRTAFKPPVEVPETAPALDRLVASLGRQPI